MRSDGRVLPDLAETLVLHELGLVRSDELPDLAARWLAADVVDSESTRMLAGHDKQDAWGLEHLLSEAAGEVGVVAPRDSDSVQAIALSWVAGRWREGGDTRAAVRTLLNLRPEFDLWLFVGDDRELGEQGWWRLEPELKAAAQKEIDYFLDGGR